MSLDLDDRNHAGTGASLAFEADGRKITIALPPPGDGSTQSAFIVGMPKAGSTLLHGMVQALSQSLGLSFVSLAQELYDRGVIDAHVPKTIGSLFVPTGYLFGGFRGLPSAVELPEWASKRTVLLVRDPRDMLVSLYFSQAFSHGAPGGGADTAGRAQFEKRRAEALSLDIDDFVLQRAKRIRHAYRLVTTKLATIDHKLYRYEDVIFSKRAWLDDLLSYLGFKVDDRLLDDVVKRFDQVPDAERPDKHVRRVTPGDFRNKLRPETVARLDEEFAPIYERFGYQPFNLTDEDRTVPRNLRPKAAFSAPSRKRIVLHVGMPKTGTTSIQSVLRGNDDRLRLAGVLYPGAQEDPRFDMSVNHRAFYSALTGRFLNNCGMADLTECRATLRDVVESFRANDNLGTLVISHELLALYGGLIGDSMARGWQDEFDLNVVLYVRPLREWVESRYVQGLWGRLSGGGGPRGKAIVKSIAQTTLKRVEAARPSVIFDDYAKALPAAAMDVRSFGDAKKDGRLISNFVEATLPEIAEHGQELDVADAVRNPTRAVSLSLFLFHMLCGQASADVVRAVSRKLAQATRGKEELPLDDKSYSFLSDDEFARLEALDQAEAARFPQLGMDAPVARRSGLSTSLTEAEFQKVLDWLKPNLPPKIYAEAVQSYGPSN